MSHYDWPKAFGRPVPPKVWARATDVLARYHQAGRAWVNAGRPEGDELDKQLEEAEEEYSPMADYIIICAALTDDQREEWHRICTSFDPQETDR